MFPVNVILELEFVHSFRLRSLNNSLRINATGHTFDRNTTNKLA